MHLDVRHLKLVREVSATGSLTRAAAVLHLTQSALSHQLRDIESRLGAPLFLRVGKRMVLSAAGERVLQSAKEVLAAIERTEEAIRQLDGVGRGMLRLTTECYTCYHWLPALLKRYRATHPQIDVRIDAAATSDPLGHLLDGRLDLAIVSDPVRDRRVVTTPLFDDEVLVIVSPQHRLAAKSVVHPEDLAGETLLTYSPKEESTLYQRYLAPKGVNADVQPVQLTEALIELVKAGLGVSALARWAVDPAIRAGAVRGVPFTRQGYKRTWCAATLKDVAKLSHIRHFIQLVAEHRPFASLTGEPGRGRRTGGARRRSIGR
jgi:LysR family transcriptional regulator for metE and metH